MLKNVSSKESKLDYPISRL